METTTQPTSNKPTVKEKVTFMINAAMYYKGISKELLYNFLLVNRQQIVSSSNGSVFNNLKTEILKQYKIVVPVENILKKGTKIFQILDSQFSIAAKKDYCYSELSKVLYAKMSKGNY